MRFLSYFLFSFSITLQNFYYGLLLENTKQNEGFKFFLKYYKILLIIVIIK